MLTPLLEILPGRSFLTSIHIRVQAQRFGAFWTRLSINILLKMLLTHERQQCSFDTAASSRHQTTRENHYLITYSAHTLITFHGTMPRMWLSSLMRASSLV